MANEGFLGRTTIQGERAATNDHPVIINAVPLHSSVAAPLSPGRLLKKMEEKEDGVVVAYSYAPWETGDATPPSAVVDMPCDPAVEKSAIAVVHGCVKTHLITPGTGIALNHLRNAGIFPA